MRICGRWNDGVRFLYVCLQKWRSIAQHISGKLSTKHSIYSIIESNKTFYNKVQEIGHYFLIKWFMERMSCLRIMILKDS